MYKDLLKIKNARIVIWIVVIVAIALFFWLTAPRSASKTETTVKVNNQLQPAPNINVNTNIQTNANLNKPKVSMPAKKTTIKSTSFTEKKAPHFVSATIANNATLNQAPDHLTVAFDTTLSKNTQAIINVRKDDITSVTMASSTINDKTMTVSLNATVSDGDYYVYYIACFADSDCSDGRFGYHLKLP